MTRQESFKRRIRARMEKTGEKYAAARRSLIEQSSGGRTWAAQPELGDEALRQATGRGWDSWCDLIDAWDGHHAGHAAVASWLQDTNGVDGWWAQTVTVGWERITGRRLPHERPDGTFTVSKSRTMHLDVDATRTLLVDDSARADLFPGYRTELRSRPTSKALRIGFEPGVAVFSFDPVDKKKTKVTVTHESLPAFDQVEEWRRYWDKWLEAIDEA